MWLPGSDRSQGRATALALIACLVSSIAPAQPLLPAERDPVADIEQARRWLEIGQWQQTGQLDRCESALGELAQSALQREPPDVAAALEALLALAELLTAADRLAEVAEVRAGIHTIAQHHFGDASWRTTSARLFARHAQRVLALAPDDRAAWRQATDVLEATEYEQPPFWDLPGDEPPAARGDPDDELRDDLGDFDWRKHWSQIVRQRREALATLRRLLGADDAQYLEALATAHRFIDPSEPNRAAAAQRDYELAAQATAQAVGPHHPWLALLHLDWFRDQVPQVDRAEPLAMMDDSPAATRARLRQFEPALLAAARVVAEAPADLHWDDYPELEQLADMVQQVSAMYRAAGDHAAAYRLFREAQWERLTQRLYRNGDWRKLEASWNLFEASRLAALQGPAAQARDAAIAAWNQAQDHARQRKFEEAVAAIDRAAQQHARAVAGDVRFEADCLHQKGVWLAERLFDPQPARFDFDEFEPAAPAADDGRPQLIPPPTWMYAPAVVERISAAGELLAQALVLRAKRLGPNHPSTRETVRALAKVHAALAFDALGWEKPAQAVAALDRLVATLTAALDPNDVEVSNARLVLRAALLRSRWTEAEHQRYQTARKQIEQAAEAADDGNPREALARLESALDELRRLGCEEEPDYADAMLQRIEWYAALGHARQVNELAAELLAVQRRALGVWHPQQAHWHQSLADLYRYNLLLDEPALYHEAAARVFHGQQVQRATGSSNGAGGDGLLERAIEVLEYRPSWSGRTAIAGLRLITESSGPTRTISYTFQLPGDEQLETVNAAARFAAERGELAAALPLARQVVELARANYGAEHVRYLEAVVNLAAVQIDVGDYEQAQRYLLSMQELADRRAADMASQRAVVRHNLGTLAERRRQYDKAAEQFRAAIELLEAAAEPDSGTLGHLQASLATAEQLCGRTDAARPLFDAALARLAAAYGEANATYLHYRVRAAVLAMADGALNDAEAVLADVGRHANVIGSQPDLTIEVEHARALLRSQQQRWAEAAEAGQRAVETSRMLLAASQLIGSERQQLAAMQTVRREVDTWLTLCAQSDRQALPALRAYEQVLPIKGAVLARRRLLYRLDPEGQLANLREEVERLAGMLADAALAGPVVYEEQPGWTHRAAPAAAIDPASPEAAEAFAQWRSEIADLAAALDEAQQLLAAQAGMIPSDQLDRPPSPEGLCKLLHPDEALIDYYVYTPAADELRPASEDRDPRQLLAFVIRRNGITLHPLGDYRPVADAVERWRRTLDAAPQPGQPSAREVLRASVWQPLEANLEGAATVIVSPDGALSSLAWSTLPGRSSTYLLEERSLVVAPVPQAIAELLTAAPPPEEPFRLGAVLPLQSDPLGAPAARRDVLVAAAGNDAPLPPPGKVLLLLAPVEFEDSMRQLVGDGDHGRAEVSGLHRTLSRVGGRLPRTEEEIEDIAQLFGRSDPRGIALLRLRGLATKQRLLAESRTAGWIHLATHGFYAAPDDEQSDGWHPGLRAGLIFAPEGDRDAWHQSGPGSVLLTAAELAEQDFNHVDLLVLSACQTGLGEALDLEGVASLQRAAHLAGVRSVLATLWSVGDRDARDVMKAFYQNLLSGKMSKAEALRRAQRELLNDQRRGWQRADDNPTETLPPARPWAGFILSGAWR